jgi:hypothetical protein
MVSKHDLVSLHCPVPLRFQVCAIVSIQKNPCDLFQRAAFLAMLYVLAELLE